MRAAPRRRVLLLLLPAAAIAACTPGEPAQQEGSGSPATPVVTAVAKVADIAIEREYPARIRGAREVEVRARVQGILEERLYKEGQAVEAGMALFRIDPAPFEVALERARARQAVAEAELSEAERDWQRVSRLFEDGAVSERQYDRARSVLELARANLRVAKAAVKEAELDLEYTQVEAPIGGITGLETLPEGSLVEKGSLLTRIVQLEPVHVRFAIPERDALIRKTHLADNGDKPDPAMIRAELILPDGTPYQHEGQVDFSASTIDAETNSQTLRAVFANPDHLLVPGQFSRIRLTLKTLTEVPTIPEKALDRTPQGYRVFVVDSEGIARARPVQPGPESGGRIAILEGLEGSEAVVVEGLVGLRNGSEVVVQSGTPGEAG